MNTITAPDRLTSVSTIVKNALILTMDGNFSVIENGAIAIREDKIAAIGTTESILAKYTSEQTIDAGDCIVIPGLINAHTHIPMTYFKGLADDIPLNPWLNDYIWPMEKIFVVPETKEAHDFVYYATLHGAAEMLRNGITFANDMYFKGEDMARAFIKAGVRCIIGEPLIENGKETNLKDIGKLALSLRKQYKGSPLLDFSLAPHAIYTNPRDVLVRCAEVAREQNMLVHMHISEAEQEPKQCLDEHGKLPIPYLQEIGLLKTRLIMAHGVYVTEGEMELLAESGAAMAICTESNLKLANGFAPIRKYLQHKVRICFGTDGVASNNNLDLLSELDFTAKVHKALAKDPTFLPAEQMLRMATVEAAKALNKDEDIGSLEPGKKADLVILDYSGVEAQPLHNPYSQVIYALGGRAVRDVIIHGEVVLKDKKLTRLDEAELVGKAKEYRAKIRKELNL
jgi:5-methylthioadenosine/S-adenosylhomocysteine deaminase